MLWYGSRHYDPEIGRFTSPDSIVPGLDNPQAWDRYSYTFNNPVRYVDPDGHFPILPFIVLIGMALILTADTPLSPPPTDFPINAPAVELCGSSLPDCFGDTVYLKDFSEHGEDNPIPIEEFEEFADKVAEDLNSHDLTWPGFEAGRDAYDTPFYNGGGRGGGKEDFPSDQQVCIETIGCSSRSDINYIAQGMWGAATGEPKWLSKAIGWGWKFSSYWENPEDDTYFWIEYGHDYYEQWLEEQEMQ